jgi:hypothetical protein
VSADESPEGTAEPVGPEPVAPEPAEPAVAEITEPAAAAAAAAAVAGLVKADERMFGPRRWRWSMRRRQREPEPEATAASWPWMEAAAPGKPATEAPAVTPAAEAPAVTPVAPEPEPEPVALSTPETVVPEKGETEENEREPVLVGAAIGGAGVAGLTTARSAGGDDGPGWRRWLGTKQVAAVVLLLLAAEIGYVVHLNVSSSSNSPNNAAAPPPLSTLPSTTAPGSSPPSVVVPAVSPKTAAPTTTVPKTAAAKPATAAAAAATTTTTAPLGYCTTSDLDFKTATNASSYSPGDAVDMTMTVTDVTSCIFQPVAVGAYDCPTTLVVSQGGTQVFPDASNSESCDPPPGQTMNPGSSESLSAAWQIPQGTQSGQDYQAVGEWGWSSGSGKPNTVNIASNPFAIG